MVLLFQSIHTITLTPFSPAAAVGDVLLWGLQSASGGRPGHRVPWRPDRRGHELRNDGQGSVRACVHTTLLLCTGDHSGVFFCFFCHFVRPRPVSRRWPQYPG